MKLYTEEQVKKLINGYYDVNWIIQDAFDELTPIELPTNEEINKEFPVGWSGYGNGCNDGAKWMKEQIIKQSK